MQEEKIPKVSVCVVTYNQEKYIRQCLQSIVDQEIDCDFEVIVGDDCSTDGTRAIVQEFVERYPGIVKPIFHEKNVSWTQNLLSVHNLARGRYVAHVDGDDYCLPGKLKRLATYLDENPGCVLVWHRMYIINEHRQIAIGMPITPISKFIKSTKLYAKDLAKYYGLTGCHSGSMYRASARTIRIRDEETLDYFFTLSLCINGGYASYIEEPYGVYRFFSTENTITRAKGNIIVGKCKLSLIRSYLNSNPELAKAFSVQCLFEFLLRGYLGYPLKLEYLKMFFACRAIPSIFDLALVIRVFLANRNTKLCQTFLEWVNINF